MKRFKKMMALALAMVMTLAMGVSAFASSITPATPSTYGTSNPHNITIVNNGNGAHTYSAYQIFAGNLDADEDVLTDIVWGSGVNGPALLTALKASNDLKATAADLTTKDSVTYDALGKALNADENLFKNCETASDVARILALDRFKTASALDVVAKIIEANKSTPVTGAADISAAANGGKAVLPVTGDGYYMVLDTTSTLPDGDTKSKIILNVVQDVEIQAKATQISPDKEILQQDQTTVKAGTAAIGDEVTFQVFIDVPDTTNYMDHFIFVMNDKLPQGLTFKSVDSISIYNDTDIETDADGNKKVKTGASALLGLTNNTNYTVTTAPYGTENTVANQSLFTTPTAPSAPDTYVTVAGGQVLKVVFNSFKDLAETVNATTRANYIGEKIVITYKAVVNDDATYGPTANKNEVEFKFSNDPNHDYDGDDFTSTDPEGKTPKSETKTYVTALEIYKYDAATGSKVALSGAQFKVTGTNVLNTVLVTGEKFVKETEFNAAAAGTYTRVGTDEYYELKDGTYTTTVAGSTLADGRVVNDTQYVDKTVKWYKVKVDDVVTEQVSYAASAISNDEGLIEFKGLNQGTYTIEETVAPEGYNKLDGTAELKIEWSDPDKINPDDIADADEKAAATAQKANGGFKVTGTDAGSFSFVTSSDGDSIATIRYEVENNKGSVLPSTGGIGTTIFYVIGAILVLGAGILLVTRRRMNAN